MTAEPSPTPVATGTPGRPVPWEQARDLAYRAGAGVDRPARWVPLASADRLTLAEPLVTLTDLPAFPTSSVDGWAVRGTGPWRVVGRVLAGAVPPPLPSDGTCVEIATGAMVPAGTSAILRSEESSRTADGMVDGQPRPRPEWRDTAEEARAGEPLLPAGTAVTPGVIGLAASCGYDKLPVRPAPQVAVLVFGDELETSGAPAAGRVRDSLGPAVPAMLRRLGAEPLGGCDPLGPVQDTLLAHVEAVRAALDAGAEVVCTTGGTMHGPVDHLHPALAELGGGYVVDTVAVRPGFPMLLAELPGGRFLAGLPGNPQSAVVALVSLVVPLLAGLRGRRPPGGGTVTLGTPIPDRGPFTHLALVRRDPGDGLAHPLPHAGSAMLRGLARASGFAVVAPGGPAPAGAQVPFVPLPLLDGEPS